MLEFVKSLSITSNFMDTFMSKNVIGRNYNGPDNQVSNKKSDLIKVNKHDNIHIISYKDCSGELTDTRLENNKYVKDNIIAVSLTNSRTKGTHSNHGNHVKNSVNMGYTT